jgi:hypothetical protein
MAIETPPYAPFGITTDTRWGAARWRRVAMICALFAFVAAGVLIAERAHRRWTANLGVGPTAVEAPVSAAGIPSATEAPDRVPKPSEPAVAPTAAPIPPTVMEPATIPAPVPEPPGPPTVLRGAGIKPR